MSGIANELLPLTLQEDDFIFLSPHKSLLARGCFATLTLPASSGHRVESEFQQRVQQQLRQAQQAGVENPIVVGAIPFDKRQACSLFIPQTCHWFDRYAFNLSDSPVQVEGQAHFIPDHDAYCAMVESALNPLRIGALDKVVLSRLLQIESIPPLSALDLWLQLNRQNPESYNFHLPLADGTLIGASPELLLRKEGHTLRSCPLAGSARRGANNTSDQKAREKLLASVKDRHEHLVVTEAIRRQLTDLCNSLTIPEPSLLSTPTLWHLATEIQGTLASDRETALSLACLLHPTPALCGAPYTSSRNLIGELEPFDRGWFGGIVGWCDAHGDGEWVVAIRCGKVRSHQIELFAGAGIVPDSVPENEWMETRTKFNTMLSALGFATQQEQTL
ncbi:isochorismate synthase [Xenorhabdus sp. KK7.4]|uniref:isochorismate synthase n=1 Tax=Xenorhabdus sp. KK7.4 TaxID=1851572 RepID=UPI000C065460|nr:isochorismate synthase [Xenorhabdus sp. KK7.4]PHM59007.1 isochorismate hydroxymutase 2, chrysobactin biosynthesis [Xenorhabdus sp. KK7.4]